MAHVFDFVCCEPLCSISAALRHQQLRVLEPRLWPKGSDGLLGTGRHDFILLDAAMVSDGSQKSSVVPCPVSGSASTRSGQSSVVMSQKWHSAGLGTACGASGAATR